jgi:hypothetical protein
LEDKAMEIKETKEVLIAVNTLVLLVVKQLKDGFQIEDLAPVLAKVFTDNKDLLDAIKGIDQVMLELKDLSFEEILGLIRLQFDFIKQYVEALK